jgi:hypothetical protein
LPADEPWAGLISALRTARLKFLRVAFFNSILEGLQTVMHYITVLLAMATRQPQELPA